MCSSYKGVLPSDLIEKYSGVGGWRRLEFDVATLGEIHDQISESSKSSKDGESMESRKRQRRAQRKAEIDGGELLDILKSRGLAIDKGD